MKIKKLNIEVFKIVYTKQSRHIAKDFQMKTFCAYGGSGGKDFTYCSAAGIFYIPQITQNQM